MTPRTIPALLSTLLLLGACGDKNTDTSDDTTGDDTSVTESDDPVVAPAAAQDLEVGDVVTYTITNLQDDQAYRVTLVSAANVTVSGTTGTFIDLDANGAADAGDSTQVATITRVNGDTFDGSKTVPGTDDDPTQPAGIFPENGQITVEITAVGAGQAWLVAYENGGASTFLELDDDGTPTEPHGIGGSISVASDGMPDVTPVFARTIATAEKATYAITDLDDGTAYRITLVVDENIDLSGASPRIADADLSGTADAGASELIGLLTMVQGEVLEGAKTWPPGTDDPTAPTGVFPTDGRITIEVTGVGAGSLRPVAYVNGGTSTFLEVDGSGSPTESFGIGGLLSVTQ